MSVKTAYAIRRGCCRVATGVTLVLVLLAPYGVQAQSKPKEYPEVALSAGAQPQYAALAMDPWKSRVAYILFDGNLAAGYRRVYVWIPDDARYGRPVALAVGEGDRFGPIEVRVEHDQDVSRVRWALTAQKRTAGGSHQQFDYATGKTTTVTTEQRDYVQFGGMANLAHGNRLDLVGQKDFPLDITVGSGLSVVADWASVGAPAAPWEHLNYRVQPRAEAAGEEATIVLTGVSNAQIRSLPEESLVEVKVRPYLEDPISSASYSADALSRSVAVTVPYGWYTVSWKLECAMLSGNVTGTTGVFPVSKPVAP